MVRILQSVNIMDRAGLETMLMNYYRNIDRCIIQFDFLTHRPTEGAYDKEIEEMGGKVYHAPRLYPQNLSGYYRFMREFYKEHKEYIIIHSHIDTMSYFPLKASKESVIPIRIAHSHSSKLDRDPKLPIKYYALKRIKKVATDYCACGNVAGRFMFGNESFKVIHNAIDLEKFRYREVTRNEIRKRLRLDDKFVVGHVGRYSYIKNQLFLIEIFSRIVKERDAVLVLVGKGPDEQKIRNKIKRLGLDNKVRLLSDRSDVDQLYQAFDVFIMPSLFEGLPVVGVEAQANGLPYYVSDSVSNEILLTGSAEQIPLTKGPDEWARRILRRSAKRNEMAVDELRNAGYDIRSEARELQNWYLELFEEIKR